MLFTVYLYYYIDVLYEDVLSLPGILNIYSVLNTSFCHRDIPHIDFYNLELKTIEYNPELETIEYNPELELLNVIQSWKLLNIIQSWQLLNVI